jgi:hypothetical protein
MDAPAGRCTFCGESFDEAHHLTGRGPDGVQLHPEVVGDLCRRHHVSVHAVLREAKIDTSPPEWSPLARVEHILRRLAAFIGGYAQRADNPVWAHIARVLEQCACEIAIVSNTGLDPA